MTKSKSGRHRVEELRFAWSDHDCSVESERPGSRVYERTAYLLHQHCADIAADLDAYAAAKKAAEPLRLLMQHRGALHEVVRLYKVGNGSEIQPIALQFEHVFALLGALDGNAGKPKRIQLSRRCGWRKPEGAVVVSRPSKWGNPYALRDYQFANADGSPAPWNEEEARAMALRDFEHALGVGLLPFTEEDVRRELRGKDLCCWCHLGKECHADVLLRIANEETSSV